jgi:hypothetical protein
VWCNFVTKYNQLLVGFLPLSPLSSLHKPVSLAFITKISVAMLSTNFFRKTSLVSIPAQTLSRAVSTYGSLDSGLVNPTFIDVALSQLLKNKKAKKNDVHEFIEHYKTRMNRQNFISMLRGCRRRHVLEPRHIYTAACGLKYAEDAPLDSAQLEQIFHSISFMSHRVASVRVLLTVTSEALNECQDKFTVDQVANFMFSLLHMKSGVPEVREMVNVLMTKLSSCDESISNESASKLIGGFRGLSSKYPEVRQALGGVLAQLQKHGHSSAPFSAAELSQALLGMRRLSSEFEDVQKLTSYVLSKAGDDSSSSMDSFQTSQAIFAVQSMDTDNEETKALFRFLTAQVEQLDAQTPLVAKSANEVMTSLAMASANAEEIASLTAALKAKIA